MRRTIAFASAALLAGCTVGPDYHKPDIKTPASFAEPAPAVGNPGELERWWTAFGDPELDRLVGLGLAQNLDIQTAASRMRQARLGEVAARAALLPSINSSADANHINFSKNAGFSNLASLFGGGSGSNQGGIALPGNGITTYSAGFDASWELDIFGGTRRSIEGAKARTEAAIWDQRDAAVSLTAEIADTYLQLRTLQQREVIARQEIARQQRAVQLADHTASAGLVPQEDMIRQRAQLASTAATLDPLIAGERVQIHALAVLLGQPPETLLAELGTARPLPGTLPLVPPGLPSDLLRRRPDVRAAERQFAAATADIGVAVADLYPRLTLTGMAEFLSTSLANLFTGNSLQWTGQAQAMFPVIDWGRRHAQVGIRKEQREQAYLAYQKAVLGALKDVEDALVRLSSERRRNAVLRQGVADADASTRSVEARYRSGLVDLSAVLQAQGTLDSARDALASSDGSMRTDLASLYKALGGGWEEPVSGTP